MSPPAGPHFVGPDTRANSTAHDKRRRWRLSSRTPTKTPLLPNRLPIPLSRLAFLRPTQWWPLDSASRCYYSPCASAPRGRAHASSRPSACRRSARRRPTTKRTTPSGPAGPCSSPAPAATTTTATRYIRAPFRSSPLRPVNRNRFSHRSCCIIGGLAVYSIPSRSRTLISFVM